MDNYNKIIETEDRFEIFIDGEGFFLQKPVTKEDFRKMFHCVWEAGVDDAGCLYVTESSECYVYDRDVKAFCDEENPWK